MEKNNKKRKWILIVAIILIVVIIIPIMVIKGVFGSKPNADWLSIRAYQGDRITVNLHVTIDGEPATVKENGIGFNLNNNDDGFQTLTDRANDYNTYKYSLTIVNENGELIPLSITVNHWNWWEIVESDLYIDIDTKTQSYKTHETYCYTAENPIYHYEKASEPEQTVTGIKSIEEYAGCKG